MNSLSILDILRIRIWFIMQPQCFNRVANITINWLAMPLFKCFGFYNVLDSHQANSSQELRKLVNRRVQKARILPKNVQS